MSFDAGVLIAGLLDDEAETIVQLDDKELTARVEDLIQASVLWEGGDLRVLDAPAGEDRPTPVPGWKPVVDDLDAGTISWIGETFMAAVPAPVAYAARRAFRVSVDTPEDARRVAALEVPDPHGDGTAKLWVAPTVRTPVSDYIWRWPLRVVTTEDRWLADLRYSAHHPTVYKVESFAPFEFEWREIAVVSADWLLYADAEHRQLNASCVIVAEAGDLEATLYELFDKVGPAIGVVVSDPPGVWWHDFFHNLSHDESVDVALTKTGTDWIIAGPDHGLDATGVARWAIAASDSMTQFKQMRPALSDLWFGSEAGGATEVSLENPGTGRSVVIDRSFGSPGGSPGPSRQEVAARDGAVAVRASEEFSIAAYRLGHSMLFPRSVPQTGPVDAPPNSGRQLIAAFYQGSERQESVLAPQTELTLALQIAMPATDDVALGVDFPDAGIVASQAELQVRVESELLDETAWLPMKLSMEEGRRHVASTKAAVNFVSGSSGTLAEFEVTVYYQGHPLQAGTLTATVREHDLGDGPPLFDRAEIHGPGEPISTMEKIDAPLDARGGVIKGRDGTALDLASLATVLDRFEQDASLALGRDDASASITEQWELLVSLARGGNDFRRRLVTALPELTQARSINLEVGPGDAILPLELAYDGPAPSKASGVTVEPCAHIRAATDGVAVDPGPCADLTSTMVCTHAFWGVSRRVSRSIRETKSDHPRPYQLVTSPVVAATSSIADEGATSDPTPSERVKSRICALPESTIASAWSDWKRAVRAQQPSMLALLCHTEMQDQELAMHLGKRKSFLAKPDLTAAYVRPGDVDRPLVLLIGCSTGAVADAFGNLPGALVSEGAAATIGLLSRVRGTHGADVLIHTIDALENAKGQDTLAGVLMDTRRRLLAEESIFGLLVTAHGELALPIA